MADNNVIEIRLTGEKVSPDSVHSRDIAELITSVEQMLASIVVKNNPQTGFSETEIIVGLVAVHKGSVRLQFLPHSAYVPLVFPAYTLVSQSVDQRDFEYLPSKAIDSLRKIRTISMRYNVDTEFGLLKGGDYQRLATVAREVPIEVKDHRVVGTTTLYGMVTRVGGEKDPRVHFRLHDSQLINCSIKGSRKRTLAKQLATRLYEEVSVVGAATWDSREWTLEDFEIEEITDYQDNGVARALHNLHQAAGEQLALIDDINAFVADIRGDDEEDE